LLNPAKNASSESLFALKSALGKKLSYKKKYKPNHSNIYQAILHKDFLYEKKGIQKEVLISVLTSRPYMTRKKLKPTRLPPRNFEGCSIKPDIMRPARFSLLLFQLNAQPVCADKSHFQFLKIMPQRSMLQK
jgi:hypothetical protein